MEWNDGYVADVTYQSTFFPAISPTHLNFACVLNHCEPVSLDGPFTYFELGFGQGFTLNLLAASNPQGRFYGNDFNPAHVASARQLAGSAGLDNVTLLENDFKALADGDVDLPQFDFITMHGVYSWVNAENRSHIVRFLQRYLKPGGIVYISYNAMPGWAAVTPMQWLLLEQVNTCGGGSALQIEQGRQLIAALSRQECGYFAANPNAFLQQSLADLAAEPTAYLAHEYLNQGWQPLYHADVARDLGAAKLEFAGSATLIKALPDLCLTPDQQALLSSVSDAGLRETVMDYLHTPGLRRDIFVRGRRPMTPARQAAWLERTGLALVRPHTTLPSNLRTPTGKTSVTEHQSAAVLDALAAGPQSWIELAALPSLQGLARTALLEIVVMLERAGLVCPYFIGAADRDPAPSRRLNAAIAERSRFDDRYQALASPLLGSGTSAGLMQRLVYGALERTAGEIDVHAVARMICMVMAEQGKPIVHEGVPLDSAQRELAHVAWTVEAILAQRVPIWRGLNIV